jgi:hypothetical protein
MFSTQYANNDPNNEVTPEEYQKWRAQNEHYSQNQGRTNGGRLVMPVPDSVPFEDRIDSFMDPGDAPVAADMHVPKYDDILSKIDFSKLTEAQVLEVLKQFNIPPEYCFPGHGEARGPRRGSTNPVQPGLHG